MQVAIPATESARRGPKQQDSANDGVIIVAGKRYLTPERLAQILRRSTHTISRWNEQRIGPPKIKIGNQPLYDEEKLPAWLAEHESKPARRR